MSIGDINQAAWNSNDQKEGQHMTQFHSVGKFHVFRLY